MIGEQFDDPEEICGAVVSPRKGQNKIALWTRTATARDKQKRIIPPYPIIDHFG
jgi:translation initiation factor 4E